MPDNFVDFRVRQLVKKRVGFLPGGHGQDCIARKPRGDRRGIKVSVNGLQVSAPSGMIGCHEVDQGEGGGLPVRQR